MAESNKYLDVIKQYETKFSDDEIKSKVDEIISTEFKANNNKDVYKKIYSCIDLTSLNTTDTKEDIWKFTETVNDFEGSSEINNVAAICVYPNMIEVVKDALTATDVKITSVAGGFPSSQTFAEVKIAETALAVANGADEIDIVLNLGLFLEENYEELAEEIDEIKHTCRTAKLKVILETGALKNLSNVAKASVVSIYSGANFIKTSTGKVYEGADLNSAYVICSVIKEYHKKTGSKIGFKASGGISTVKQAVEYYSIVKSVLGDDWCNNNLFRIGASRLKDDILKHI